MRSILDIYSSGEDCEVRVVPCVKESGRDAGNLRPGDVMKHRRRFLALTIRNRELGRFIQFCLVGLSGAAVNMGTFLLLWRVAHVDDRVSLVCAYTAATLSNFILNDFWTFRDRRAGGLASLLSRAPKFALVSAVAIGLYYAIYIPLTRYLEMYELLALAAAIGVGLAWNFTANVLWTWKKRSPGDSLK